MKVKNLQKRKQLARGRRHGRVRSKVSGTASRPRLSVFRSAKHLFVQLIDDEAQKTLVAASDRELPKVETGGKVPIAEALGKLVAERAVEKGIKQIVFDRGGYAYHGRVKAIADGSRAGGLEF
ncbi:50S ribosomal protein L18 [Candidatus Uhrbacteria bacterium]|nr:50S ribosomal protein L18 [Candidatus Uhrbacteria bacterium]